MESIKLINNTVNFWTFRAWKIKHSAINHTLCRELQSSEAAQFFIYSFSIYFYGVDSYTKKTIYSVSVYKNVIYIQSWIKSHAYDTEQKLQLMFSSNIRIQGKCDLGGSDCSWTLLGSFSVSKTADLLRF